MRGRACLLFVCLVLLLVITVKSYVPPCANQQSSPGNYSTTVYTYTTIGNLICGRLLTDPHYAADAAQKRIALVDPAHLGTSCEAIRSRVVFNKLPLSPEEASYPIAHVRAVYRDYLYLEQLLAAEYHPQNTYCYVLDEKADTAFKHRLRSLSNCFDNVIVADEEPSIFSSGKNGSRGILIGLKTLLPFHWNYVFLLQNHDIPLRTNLEKVRILKIFNGTNDVSTTRIMPWTEAEGTEWSFEHLHLFRNTSLNVPDKQLRLTKSMVQVAVSRTAVDFIFTDLNVHGFIRELEKAEYGMDEDFLSTLNSNDAVGLPGGFTTRCIERDIQAASITRKSFWMDGKLALCKSQIFRHCVCIAGVEDLGHLGTLPNFYFNKMLPNVDYGAAACWLAKLKEREQAGIVSIKESVYARLAHVRFNRWRKPLFGADANEFQCDR